MTKPPVENGSNRHPGAYAIEDEEDAIRQGMAQAVPRLPRSFDGEIDVTPDADDPFIGAEAEAGTLPIAVPRRRLAFWPIATGAFGILFSLAAGLWTDRLIRDLFERADWLGYTALTVAVIGIAAVIAIAMREVAGMMRLSAVHTIRAEAEAAALETRPARARALVKSLEHLLASKAETAKGRATLAAAKDDIIDAPHLIALAERELLAPLDRQARALILNSSKRVSVVTAVSPRAVVDLLYVVFEASRLVRAMADLYGGRPGTLGMIRLMRDVVAHLAVTGSIAVGDGLVQQLLGHGIASRLSARLGEGVINGLMTARIGIAAMDLCRPLPFKALKRPGIGDFISDLTPPVTGARRDR